MVLRVRASSGNPACPSFGLSLRRVKPFAILQSLEDRVLEQVLQLLCRQIPASSFAVDFDTLPYGFENLLIGNGFAIGGGKCGIRVRLDVLHSASSFSLGSACFRPRHIGQIA